MDSYWNRASGLSPNARALDPNRLPSQYVGAMDPPNPDSPRRCQRHPQTKMILWIGTDRADTFDGL